MRKFIFINLIPVLLLCTDFVQGQVTEKEEAAQVAYNWIQMVLDRYGHWGESESASVQAIQEFTGRDRLIGYFCPVTPHGFIIISVRKELAPVKAYSEVSDLDPADEGGMMDLIKSNMLRIIDTIESQLGPVDQINPSVLTAILEIDYSPAWNYILEYIPGTLQKNPAPTDNYQEGEELLTSDWHQNTPYNNFCPYMECSTTLNGNALVGCVATAGAQIMRYWSWPPYGLGTGLNDPYDWANMPDFVTTSSPAAEQDAVAELCSEVGIAVDMNYGCSASGATTSDMVLVYILNYFYHSTCTWTERSAHTADGWFDLIKWNINANRPIHYRIPGHSIVCDGWQDWTVPVLKQYHMNYGWANSATTWYTLDELQGGNPAEEYMVLNIVPAVALGANLSGTYTTQSFPYRYFDLDASGTSATFSSGQLIQMLPNLTVTGTGASTFIRFYGSSDAHTRIFTSGNPYQGIAIKGGGIRLGNYGAMKFQ